jgi:hypothetical protein
MCNLSKLQEYISSPLSVDYWSDEGIDEALLTARYFDSDDWARVEKEWSCWSDIAQIRLAELLSECASFEVERKRILKAMCLSDRPDLVETAKDSLSL